MKDQNEIQLYLTPPHSCSYLVEHDARMLFVNPNENIDIQTLSRLSRDGFRRSGDFIYKPQCKHCTQCLSVRLPVHLFKPNKSQKRTLKKNQDLSVTRIRSSEATEEHYYLYERYIHQRHSDGDMFPPSPEQFIKFLVESSVDTFFLEFRLDEKLICVATCDNLDDGISAVYTFFHPDYDKRSLGTLAILLQIDWAKKNQKEYVYLGYWVPESQKMRYKQNFMPLDIMINNRWQRITKKLSEQQICKLLLSLQVNKKTKNTAENYVI